MHTIDVDRNAQGECILDSACVSCGTDQDLDEQSYKLQGSSVLQLLAVVPWIAAGPALKMEAAAWPAALFASIFIYWVTTPKLTVRTSRCSTCVSKQSKRKTFTMASLFLGVMLIVVAVLNTASWALPMGATGGVLFLISLFGYLGVQQGPGIKLVLVNRESARLKVPKLSRPDPATL
jgi:hypothetical protein